MPIVPSRAKQIQELLARLDSESATVREGAVARLTLLGLRVVGALLAALRTASPRSRLGMLEVLERVPDRRALPEILTLVRAEEPEVAGKAVELAGAYPQPRTVAALAKVLAGGPPDRREAAALSLARIHAAGVLEAIDPLLDVLLDDDEDDELRLGILETQSTLPTKTLLPILKRLRTTRSPALAARVAALEQHRGGSGAGPQELVEKFDRLLSTANAGQEVLVADLAAHGGAALELLLDRLEKTRRAAAAQRLGRALSGFGEEALGCLHRAVGESENPLALKVLAQAIGQLRSPASIPVLHRCLERLSPRAGGGEAAAVAEAKAQIHLALAALGTRIALYDLREMLAARPPWAAPLLLEAAAHIGEASLVPALAALAHDQPSSLNACATAFAAIAHREKLRRTSAALRAVKPEHRKALDGLWSRHRGAGPP